MSILAIDTTNTGSSIAIVDCYGNYFIEYNFTSHSHTESFFKVLDSLFIKHNYDYDKIDHLAVVTGPGSFTGIRVGISVAKGMSLATNKPLYGVNALEVQAYAISSVCKNNRKNIRSMIKNSQGFYTQLFNSNLLPISEPEMISEDELGSSTYKDRHLPEINASHAGLLIRYRMQNQQKLNEAKALYLNEPEYISKFNTSE